MTKLLLDIGGSGVKYAVHSGNYFHLQSDKIAVANWQRFHEVLKSRGFYRHHEIAISCAGSVNDKQVIERFTVGNWHHKNLVAEIKRFNNGTKIAILNDAEAHLYAHLDLFERPVMCVSIGTSLGFAVSNQKGTIIRPDAMNFDIGAFLLSTSCSNKQLWFALGSRGLGELENLYPKSKAVQRFGCRLGSFLANMGHIFRPKTIILTGGIIHGHPNLINFVKSEYDHYDKGVVANIDISPYGNDSALVGAGKFHEGVFKPLLL